jgi:ribokinase
MSFFTAFNSFIGKSKVNDDNLEPEVKKQSTQASSASKNQSTSVDQSTSINQSILKNQSISQAVAEGHSYITTNQTLSSKSAKQPAVLTIGSALVDIFISSDQFEISHGDEEVFTTRSRGGKLLVDSFKIKTGGGGGNTAVGFAKLGFEVSCVAELGIDELAELVVADLRDYGVKTTHLIQERKEETGGSVLLVSSNGERTALVHRGAAALLDPHDINETLLAKQNWIHLASVSGRTQTISEVFRIAHANSIPISWNPGQLELEALAKMSNDQEKLSQAVAQFQRNLHPVKVLFVNKQEWQVVSEIQPTLLKTIETVVVTDSVRGGSVFQAGSIKSYQAQAVSSVDNTGAGDAFAVGFIAATILKKTVATAIDWGVKNSASVVKFPGAKVGLLTLVDLEQNE